MKIVITGGKGMLGRTLIRRLSDHELVSVDLPEVDSAELVIPTPSGDIVSAWRRAATGRVGVRLKLPQGVTADVRLPGLEPTTATGSSQWRVSL